MGKVYVNQTSLRLKLTTSVDITDTPTLQIKYIKPDGVTTGTWTATAWDETNGIIYHDFSTDELDTAGRWIVWAYVVFDDGRAAPGEPYKFRVYEEGT
jgi:hypothetical protein